MNERDEFDQLIEQEQDNQDRHTERSDSGAEGSQGLNDTLSEEAPTDVPAEMEGVILSEAEGSQGLNDTTIEAAPMNAPESDQNIIGHPEWSDSEIEGSQGLNDTTVEDETSDTPASPEEAPAKSKHSRARSLTLKIAITGVFTALSYGLYLLGKFCKLPFMFPSFLDLQFSELPALIVGFALGPVYGGAVVVIKCLLKMPMTSTAFVGEATDILLGLLFVLPGTILYRFKRNLKGAVWGAVLGSVIMTAGALLVNRFISIPFYLHLFFKDNWAGLVGMLSGLFPKINQDNFYVYYLLGSVLPFNLLRALIMCLLTFAVYKRTSRLIHRITQ